MEKKCGGRGSGRLLKERAAERSLPAMSGQRPVGDRKGVPAESTAWTGGQKRLSGGMRTRPVSHWTALSKTETVTLLTNNFFIQSLNIHRASTTGHPLCCGC